MSSHDKHEKEAQGLSPSLARRDALKERDRSNNNNGGNKKSFILSNLCPIERYYTAADKVLQAFELCLNDNRLDDAYVYGLRFANFSTVALPTHDYYDSRKPIQNQLRRKNQKNLGDVVDQLENVVKMMDIEELEREKRDAELQRGRKETILKERLRQIELMFPRAPTGFSQDESQDKIQDNDILNIEIPNIEIPNQDQDSSSKSNPFSSPSLPLPSPIPPPPLPPLPTYSQLLQQGTIQYKNDTSVQPPPPAISTTIAKLPPQIPLSVLRQKYNKQYHRLIQTKKIQVFPLSTYQGRLAHTQPHCDSTNGCTVISPLVAAHHLSSHGAGISDSTIETIIDQWAPPVLRKVRNSLGLGKDALIVPSDVHDSLVDDGVLKQDGFVGVCGGNLLDDNHVHGFLELLGVTDVDHHYNHNQSPIEYDDDDPNIQNNHRPQKVAAALFFHEHVISILKVVPTAGVGCWYDFVDSLPCRQTVPTDDDNGNAVVVGATRTRCRDRKSLETTLGWYACNKFSEADLQYINKNEWNDSNSDFDPRVFQAFAWKEIISKQLND